ncbi:hypothetical protein EMPG_17175 [Blastomyces silverae]|uniref:Uncharacterized protein n=1 Tax=Blastomyces silverae TaxID=2060906 RepID=A0A0H1B8N5_9EURO|nr:hypothetical protein EMPG_17175 [Blastomyces silverae]
MMIVVISVMRVMRRLTGFTVLYSKSSLQKCRSEEPVLVHLRYGAWIVVIILTFL